MTFSSTLVQLPAIVQDLQEHKDALRLKKLILYTCKNHWAKDPQTLNKYPLEQLLEELYQLNPSIDNLSDK